MEGKGKEREDEGVVTEALALMGEDTGDFSTAPWD